MKNKELKDAIKIQANATNNRKKELRELISRLEEAINQLSHFGKETMIDYEIEIDFKVLLHKM